MPSAGAASLIDAIESHPSDLHAALLEFDARRRHFGTVVIQCARDLRTYMQGQNLTAAEQIIADRHRSVEAVMTQTAVTTGVVV